MALSLRSSPKRSGEIRYAVEDDRGLILIMNEKQIEG